MSDKDYEAIKKTDFNLFGNEIFSAIEEDQFWVLYSLDEKSRPCIPCNILVAALILKEMMHVPSDEQLIENIRTNKAWQYALHLLPGQSGLKQDKLGISERSIRRFRQKCIQYQEDTGINLIKRTVTKLADKICNNLHINKELLLLDSFMCDSNIRNMTRLEIVYAVVSNMVRCLNRLGKANILDGHQNLQKYLDKANHNKVIYRTVDVKANERLVQAVRDAIELQQLCKEVYGGYEEWQNLDRAIGDQTTLKDGKYILKEGKDISPTSLQNPADPTATYRFKLEPHKGYVVNVVAAVRDGTLIVIDYQVEQNIYSDVQFAKDTVKNYRDCTFISDAAYGSMEILRSALKKTSSGF